MVPSLIKGFCSRDVRVVETGAIFPEVDNSPATNTYLGILPAGNYTLRHGLITKPCSVSGNGEAITVNFV